MAKKIVRSQSYGERGSVVMFDVCLNIMNGFFV